MIKISPNVGSSAGLRCVLHLVAVAASKSDRGPTARRLKHLLRNL